jgi:hypothetical protein
MPIVIKELFPSDPISEAIEKLNFNFDQLLLAGGGPPGPIGPGGPPGPIGPQGTRGDHWFTGATYGGLTADHDGVSPLQVQDNFIDPNGDIWNYFDIMGSTGWTYSGINLRGPGGSAGATGGSLEWSLYLGASGNAISASNTHWGPAPGPTTVDNGNLNFIAPLGATKNGLLLGDPDWFYNSVLNWNNIPQYSGANNPDVEGTPRLTVIQREVDEYGINGIQIGAQGLTGATISGSNPIGLASVTPLPSTQVNAYDFVSLGIGINRSLPAEIIENGPQYWSHSAMIKTWTRDISIEAGGPDPTLPASIPNTLNPSIRLKSNRFTVQSHDGNRWISSGIRTNSSLSSKKSHVIQINANRGTFVTSLPYIQFQGQTGTPGTIGPVIIGSFNDAVYTNEANSSLIITKPINTASTSASGILFVNEALQSGSSDFVGKIIHVQNPSRSSTIQKGLILSSQSISIAPATFSMSSEHQGRFPFHVNQLLANIETAGWGWPGQPNSWINANGGFGGWLAGFDKFDNRTSTNPLTQTTARGLGIGYIKNQSSFSGSIISKEMLIQTYFTGSTPAASDPGGSLSTTSAANNTSSAFGSLRGAPHLYAQLGDQNSNGNLGIGLGASGENRNPWSKLTVNGTIRIGTATSQSGIFDTDRGNGMAPGGIFAEGRIVRGFIPGATTGTWYSTAGLTSGQVLTMIEGSIGFTGGTGIGISSIGWIMGDYFLAKGGSGPTSTAYSLADGKSGMRLGSFAGDAYLVAANNNVFSTINSSTTTSEILRFSTRGDFGVPLPGSQTRGVYAESPLYLDTTDLMRLGLPTRGGMGADYETNKPNTFSWRYVLHQIPTNRSIVFLDLRLKANWLTGFGSSAFTATSVTTPYPSGLWLNDVGIPNFNSKLNSVPGWTTRRYFLEPGGYDGQHLSLICGDVDQNNEFVIYQGGPFPGNSNPGPTITIADRHILASTSRDDVALINNAFASGTWDGAPYPFPIGATLTNSTVTPANSAVGNEAVSVLNWFSELHPAPVNIQKSGAFVVRPWRVLNLRWVKIEPTVYAWVEIGREYLGANSVYPHQTTLTL